MLSLGVYFHPQARLPNTTAAKPSAWRRVTNANIHHDRPGRVSVPAVTRLDLRVFACTTVLALALLPNSAEAGGFEVPDQGARAVGRGGAYAVGAADLTALHYNPGKLASLGGTRVMYSHNL